MHTRRRRSKAVFEDAKHVLNFMRLETAQDARERGHPQGSTAGLGPQNCALRCAYQMVSA